jgi:hypothetical protein
MNKSIAHYQITGRQVTCQWSVDGVQYFSETFDFGRTWSAPQPLVLTMVQEFDLQSAIAS